MITGISHITFIVKNLDRTANLFKKVFDAKEIYTSEEKKHSLYKEKFFLIGNQWIAIMESEAIVHRTYHHIAFKIEEQDIDIYLKKIKNLNLELKPPRQRISGEGYSIYFYDYDNNLFELHTGTLSQRLTSYEQADNEV
ncbi:FosX/FosE/FosI family fosfomycin resistance hydrolase [Anaerosinus gibii]|uniref:FosX/FosE/FosI family fosfomycin resistance hydrolase n=1 Tax=Selenobaculum gibii TaxID=3054208 RepID=A0A9Y2EV89_9FIRM|nr:FosX/FosE/FosI family fosfomycin resistance hydrolase [Selenobaculum gbiensis]WIW70699.1 FosX/FosE/FosI family fosfomycin resistance hydrolase [Selenobaculum gbiensis]